jgi:hypothetical protein
VVTCAGDLAVECTTGSLGLAWLDCLRSIRPLTLGLSSKQICMHHILLCYLNLAYWHMHHMCCHLAAWTP